MTLVPDGPGVVGVRGGSTRGVMFDVLEGKRDVPAVI